MSLFGIPDPWIWMSYVGCIVSIAVCMIWANKMGAEADTNE